MLWLRFENEAAACPACGSARIEVLDVLSIPRDPITGRRVAFVTGCHDCGVIFANPLPAAEQLERYYSTEGSWAASHQVRVRTLEQRHARRMKGRERIKPARGPRPLDLVLDALVPFVPIYEPPPGANALDFGCGDGKFLDRLQNLGWQTSGIEPSTNVAFLRHRRLESPPHDASVDFVILHHVLEHSAEPLTLLRRLADAVRPSGMLFVSVPRLDALGQHRDLHYCVNGRTHLVAFTKRCLEGLLARAGFEVAAVLDGTSLDEAQTEGQPLRLRIVARRTSASVPLPPSPLEPARVALRQYARGSESFSSKWLPVRVRAALVDRARERSAPRGARAERDVRP